MPADQPHLAPFRAATAYRQGIQRSELLGKEYRRVIHGVYVPASAADRPGVRAAAALVPHPADAYASHFTAARLWGLPVPADPSEDVSVTHANHRRRRRQVRVHIAPAEAAVRVVDGLRVSAPTQVFTELAALIPLVDSVALGDCAVRRQLCTLEELAAAAAKANRAARRAVGYVRLGVDSP
ncbi:MAG: hypothetical protein JWO63_2258, partial [Frankiales bacterium]|nr:hypothetical protein [Frankiales bacterium]